MGFIQEAAEVVDMRMRTKTSESSKTDLESLNSDTDICYHTNTHTYKMSYYERDLDYDVACHMKEQRDYQRYYNTPLEVDGMWFASVADYEQYYRIKAQKETRCQKMTIELKALIKEMVLEEKVEQMFANLDEFPPLSKQ